MNKVIATFSNGYTDEYKGNRNVRAAWAIIDRETGEVRNSGHSLDKETAQRTGTNTLRTSFAQNPYRYIGHRCPRHIFSPMQWQRLAIVEASTRGYPATYEGVQQAKADLAAKRDKLMGRYTVEVVEI